MIWIALRMLTGDSVKYLGMVFGVAFSTLLITQQSSIFVGLVKRASTAVNDVRVANLWIMDPRIEAVDSAWPLPDTALYRVRGVPGVAWAAPFLKSKTTIVSSELPLETAALYGVDDASLVGMPPRVVAGSLDALKAPGTVMMDANGWKFLFGERPFQPGTVLELNDNRAQIVGLVEAGTLFDARVAIYTRYSTALNYAPGGRHRLSFVVARTLDGEDPAEVASRITEMTGLKALTDREFALASSVYLIGNSGIPIVFGAVVALGVVVGIVIVALTFSLFIRDNLKQFGALKAIGVSNGRLRGMVLLQGALVGVIGYALGVGAATIVVTQGARNTLELAGFYVPWQVAAGSSAVVMLIVTLAGMGGLRKVLKTDPAEVFR